MTGRMLDMFRRDDDAKTYTEYYAGAGAVCLAAFAALGAGGNEGLTDMSYMLASLACIIGRHGILFKLGRLGIFSLTRKTRKFFFI